MLFREERDLLRRGVAFPRKKIDRLLPGSFLATVEFPQVEDVSLENSAAGHSPVFDNTPVKVLFTALVAFFAAKKRPVREVGVAPAGGQARRNAVKRGRFIFVFIFVVIRFDLRFSLGVKMKVRELRRGQAGSARLPFLAVFAGIGVASTAMFGWTIFSRLLLFSRAEAAVSSPAVAAASVSSASVPAEFRSVPKPMSTSLAVYPAWSADPPRRDPAVVTSPQSHFKMEGIGVLPVSGFDPGFVPRQRPQKDFLQDLRVASVHLGDMPYLILASGERVYPGTRLGEGFTLEAIGSKSLIFSSPSGLIKLPSNHPLDAAVFPLEELPTNAPLPDLGGVGEYPEALPAP